MVFGQSAKASPYGDGWLIGRLLGVSKSNLRAGLLVLSFALHWALPASVALTLSLPAPASATAKYCDPDEPDNDGDEELMCRDYSKVDTIKSNGGNTADSNCVACQAGKFSGNPIDNTTGNKYETTADYVGAGAFPISLIRHYNSQATPTNLTASGSASAFGSNWSHEFSGNIQQVSNSLVYVQKADAKTIAFTLIGGVWKPDADINAQLTQLSNGQGWRYTTGADSVETYNASGQLTQITNRAGLTHTLTYDSAGLLYSVSDQFGRSLRFAYDAQKRIIGVADPLGGTYAYQYDSNNNLIWVRFPDNNAIRYLYENSAFPHALTGLVDENGARFATWTYNAKGEAISSEHGTGVEKVVMDYDFTEGITKVVDALGNTTSYGYSTLFGIARTSFAIRPGIGSETWFYDNNGNVKIHYDPNQNQTFYTYDQNRNLEISRTLPTGKVITTQWHSTLRLPVTITEPTRVQSFTYDAQGNVLQRTITAGSQSRTWKYSYNAYGQVLTVDGPRTDVQDITSYTYDTQGNLASVTNALGHITRITSYNAAGQPLSMTNPNGLVTTMTYDTRQRLTSMNKGGEVTSYTYDAAGNLTKITLPDGSFANYSYDVAHRLIATTDALGNQMVSTLDDMSNQTKVDAVDASGNVTQTKAQVFDAIYRAIKVVGAQGQSTAVRYDSNGNITGTTDPMGSVRNNQFDSLDRLASARDTYSTVTYTYNNNDQVINVLDPRSKSTAYGVDPLNNVTSVASPDSGTSSNTYDAAGNALTSTDARGKITTVTYDAVNRPLTVTFADGKSIVYTYDSGANALGRLTSVTDASGSTAWLYDAQGRITQKKQTIGAATLTTVYTYDAQGRLRQTTYPSGRRVAYTMDAAGKVDSITVDGQALITKATYRPFAGPASWVWGSGSTYNRTFDLDGRLTSFPLGSNIRSLSYDAAGRITGFSDSVPIQYASLPNSTTTLAIASTSNRLVTKTAGTTQTFTYDAAGNVLADGTNTFAYDARGRMTQVVAGASTVQYQVNGLGQRVSKTGANVANGGQYFAYDEAGHLIGEYGANLTAVQETIWLGDLPVGVVKPTSGLFYVFPDQLGTPRAVTTTSIRTVWRWESDPFGNGAPTESADDTGVNFKYNLRFPGQYFDAESGLHYNYFRDYAPGLGRYAQSDPIGLAGGVNTYAYVNGSPTTKVDSLGLDVLTNLANNAAGIPTGNALGSNWKFAFSAGAHIWAFPYPGAGGMNFASNWVPGGGLDQANFEQTAELVTGALWDIGVNAGISGVAKCQSGKPWQINLAGPLGKYAGVQVNFKGQEFDGFTVGLGLGMASPVTVTTVPK